MQSVNNGSGDAANKQGQNDELDDLIIKKYEIEPRLKSKWLKEIGKIPIGKSY